MTDDLATGPASRLETESATASAIGRHRLVCGSLAVAAVAAAANVLARPLSSAEFEVLSLVTGQRGPQWWFAVAGGVAFGAVALCLGLAVASAVTGRGARWATVGAALSALGGLLFAAGFTAFGAVNWYATGPGGGEVFAAFRDDPARVFGVQAAGFGIASLGTLILSAALWRSAVVARWAPVVVAATLVLMVGIGGDGRLYDVLLTVHMLSLVVLAGLLWRVR